MVKKRAVSHSPVLFVNWGERWITVADVDDHFDLALKNAVLFSINCILGHELKLLLVIFSADRIRCAEHFLLLLDKLDDRDAF